MRLQRSLFDKATGSSRPMDSKIATLEFSYKANLKMKEEDRIENPLGFQVTSYRVDNDYAASPPLESRPAMHGPFGRGAAEFDHGSTEASSASGTADATPAAGVAAPAGASAAAH